jgi:hypothetical protein
MPAKLTKKAMREAVTPFRKAAERFGCSLLTGGPRGVPKPSPLEWNGFTIDVEYVRRSRVVCGVPAPHYALEFWYSVTHAEHGQLCRGVTGSVAAIDAAFTVMRRRGVL